MRCSHKAFQVHIQYEINKVKELSDWWRAMSCVDACFLTMCTLCLIMSLIGLRHTCCPDHLTEMDTELMGGSEH